MKNIKITFLVSAIAFSLAAKAADEAKKDTIPTTEKGKPDQGLLLNASNATQPRAVPIGLPAAYTVVSQDGLPAVYFWDPNATNTHWRNELSLSKVGPLPMSMTAILQGEVGVGVDSYTQLGGDKFKGRLKYGANTYGKQNFDINVSGPIKKSWYYTLSAYQNFDPGSTDLKFTDYKDRAQFYTAGLTHKYNHDQSQFSVFYKHTNLHMLNGVDGNAPFIYNGDGSITELKNFRIGRDSYAAVDGMVEYVDVETGKKDSKHVHDLSHVITHEGKFLFDHLLGNGMNLALKAKVSTSDIGDNNDATQVILQDQNVSYADGSGTYTGDIQRRLTQIYNGNSTDALFIASLNKKTEHHDWTWAIFDYYNASKMAKSTTQYYHEVAVNPKKVLYNGKLYLNNNASAEYIDGWENKLGAYILDTWQPTDMVKLTYGGRMEYFYLNVDNISEERFAGFHLGAQKKDGSGAIGLTNHTLKGLNYAFSVIPTINFTRNFGFDGELNFLTMYRHLQGFYGNGAPVFSNRPHTLGRAGLFWNHPLASVVTSFAYSFRKNDNGRITVPSEDPNVASVMVPYVQAIKTMGWKTDVLLNPFKGFQLNLIFTLQSPKLDRYSFEAYGKEYDYSGMYCPNLSKVILEISPRYSYKKMNVWANLRYYSKQYANVGNSIYFNGRWETFAGASYQVNKFLTLNANVVNFLNQRGASGNVPGSALVTDGSQYAGTVIAGSYIRPLEVEFGARINF